MPFAKTSNKGHAAFAPQLMPDVEDVEQPTVQKAARKFALQSALLRDFSPPAFQNCTLVRAFSGPEVARWFFLHPR